MHPQLQAIIDEFDSASVRLHALADHAPEAAWTRALDPRRWSAAECVAHLNLISRAALPALDDAIARGRTLRAPVPRRYRRDPLGWILWSTIGPPVRLRFKTAAGFVPKATDPPRVLIEEFARLQAAQITCVRQADGLPLQRIRLRSIIDARVTYNLYALLTILPRHQHRHLWQAEQLIAGRL